MSTNEQTPISQPTFAVRNMLGKEQVSQDSGRPAFDATLRKYCERNYHRLLPIIAEKVHQEKVQQEKLKAVKAHLNFEEASQYSESGTSSKRRSLKERLGSRHVRRMSGSPEPRRDHSKSPRKKGPEKRTVFKRLDKGVFHRLRDKGKRSKDSAGGHQKSKPKRRKSSIEDDLSQPWAAAKTERWAMPTWCHRFNSTLTGNARVWFDYLPRESIDSYDDLKKAFLENYLQQKKCITDPVEIHHIKQIDGESTKEFVRRYKLECRDMKGAPECMKISGFMHGIINPALIKRLHDKIPNWTEAKLQEGRLSKPTKVRAKAGQGEDGTEGLMIIEAEMGGHFVHRMYVDGGSSSEIMYEHCFNRFRPEVKSQMVPATTPLVGFSGEIIWPLGQISLLVKIGDEEHSTSAWMNFMIVRSSSPYNKIIGRPGVRRIQAFLSTAHGMLKFPVTSETVTLRSSRIIPLEWRKELCGLLRRNLDIFAWKPADMIGVSHHIAEHSLNIRKGCPPIRQKKRGQAPERNNAIYEEVEKLVDAGIMKEVHYHSWLSNPVMVKKHDGIWRMCVDFKDLSKACLKDGYPLPKIDWKVESLCGYPFKCFVDAYKGYHQIKMAKMRKRQHSSQAKEYSVIQKCHSD
uniref:Reverse transcriptase domain-containing protein n=1 Tax=Tanacetum cinerariifolium TaxID=118510 RepID=A0A699IJH9_TANCI|nr:reverse transcriptase domain-containing protein [Tanacetum cinerariifolium]